MYGGIRQIPSNYPFIVYLYVLIKDTVSDYKAQCTGTFVTQSAVFTVAHCFFYANGTKYYNNDVVLQWWYAGQFVRRRSEILLHHPNFKSRTESDFGIAYVDTLWFKSVGAIHHRRLAIQMCNMYTYGRSEPKHTGNKDVDLRSVPIKISEQRNCNPDSERTRTVLCGLTVMEVGICPGDDGAVLICDGFVHGLFVMPNTKTSECVPTKGVVLYFTNIYSFKDYINDKTGLELASSHKTAEIYLILAGIIYNLF